MLFLEIPYRYVLFTLVSTFFQVVRGWNLIFNVCADGRIKTISVIHAKNSRTAGNYIAMKSRVSWRKIPCIRIEACNFYFTYIRLALFSVFFYRMRKHQKQWVLFKEILNVWYLRFLTMPRRSTSSDYPDWASYSNYVQRTLMHLCITLIWWKNRSCGR